MSAAAPSNSWYSCKCSFRIHIRLVLSCRIFTAGLFFIYIEELESTFQHLARNPSLADLLQWVMCALGSLVTRWHTCSRRIAAEEGGGNLAGESRMSVASSSCGGCGWGAKLGRRNRSRKVNPSKQCTRAILLWRCRPAKRRNSIHSNSESHTLA